MLQEWLNKEQVLYIEIGHGSFMAVFFLGRIMCPYIKLFNIVIPSYGLCMVLATVVMVLFAVVCGKKRNVLMEDIFIVASMICAFALVGAKALYIAVTYSFLDIFECIKNGDLRFFGGSGLVFLGGLLFAIPGAYFGALITKRRFSTYEDLFVPIAPVGHMIGRIGCLLAGCCYGVLYQGPFAIHYKNVEAGGWSKEGYFPVQLLEALLNGIIFLLLYHKSKSAHKEYGLLLDYFFMYSIMRFCLEFLRGDVERGIYAGVSTSQWICIIMIVINIFIRFFRKNRI